ncbi:MAG: glycosyltransferase [Nitrososphaerota archaeon]|nr:glycosyltransferase [Nitrososphaerota archaeon]
MVTLFEVNAADVLLGASILLSCAFFVYGINILHLTRRSKRYTVPKSEEMSTKPTVAIHLPVYNELYVVERLVGSCVKVASRYGKDLVRICVIDDSSDETSKLLDELAGRYQSQGFKMNVLRRGERSGFKAGALQAALLTTEEEYIAVLDADFVPPEDFLDRTVPFLQADPSVGFVQCRWGHLDRKYNLMTESIAIGIDAHFLLEQQGRNSSHYLMNFNGSAGVLRKKAITDAGGWAPDTLAEDLDVSYRMQLAGYRGVFVGDLEVPGELPPTISSLKRQQGRWARGSLQTAKKLLRQIHGSKDLTRGQKIEADIHLTYYLVHPLMVASFLLAALAALLNVNVINYTVNVSLPDFTKGVGANLTAGKVVLASILIAPWIVFSVLVVLSTLSVLYYCTVAIRTQHLGLLANVKEILFLLVLGYGMSISNSVQAFLGIFSKNTGTFKRTPKYAITRKEGSWSEKQYQLPLNATNLFEAGGIVLAVLAMARAIQFSNFGILPILGVYATGYAFVFGLTVKQTFSVKGSFER